MRKSPSTTIEKLCSLLQNSKPGNSVPTLFTAARAFSTNVAVNRPRQHDKNRDDNSETPQYWPGVANENQCPQCPSSGPTRTSSLGAARPLPPSADISPGGQSVGQAAQLCLERLVVRTILNGSDSVIRISDMVFSANQRW